MSGTLSNVKSSELNDSITQELMIDMFISKYEYCVPADQYIFLFLVYTLPAPAPKSRCVECVVAAILQEATVDAATN